MKIGIITHFHKSINYGGVLQAYALCKYLNDHNHSAFQILYTHKVTKVTANSVTLKELIAKTNTRIQKKIYRTKNRQIKRRMESLFADFRNDVPHTTCEYSKANISDVSNDFDAFITGSDQVWNPIWFDSTYLLDFVGANAKKLSYAASMGVGKLDVQQKSAFKEHLDDFTSISVRERAAADALSTAVDKQISVSVDPTLLLSVDEWDKVAAERKIDGRYVFLYLLGDDTRARKLAEAFARRKGLKLVMIPDLLGSYRAQDRKIRGEMILDATPNDFISLVKHADYVFTDSFHACVFSLLYKREFFAFKRKGSMEMGSRIRNLTGLFECPERFCVSKDEMTLEHLLMLKPMDYSGRYDLFINEKQMSEEYLRDNLC